MEPKKLDHKNIDFLALGQKESSQGKHLIVITGGHFFIWSGRCFQTPLNKSINVTPSEMNELAKERACFVCSAPDTDAAVDMYMSGTWKTLCAQAEIMSEMMLQSNIVPVDSPLAQDENDNSFEESDDEDPDDDDE